MKYVIKEIRRNWWRTAFIVAGYSIAAVFIMLITGISDSNKNDTFGILKSTGTHFIVYIPTSENCCTSCTETVNLVAEGVKTMMMDNEMISTIKNVKGVSDAAPCLLYKMYDERFATDISLSGIDTTSVATKTNVCSRTNLIAGKFLPDNPNELVTEQSFASAHNLKLGDTLEIFGGKMTLAGIINSGIKPVKADFYAPIGFVRAILKDRLQCTSPYFDMNIILVEVADSRLQEEVMSKIRGMMYKFAVSSYNCYEPAYKVMSMIDRSSLGLMLTILVFLVVFSAKTQLTALTERFRELGILKSLGWSDIDLSLHILLVSFILALAGVTIGILVGTGIIAIINGTGSPIFNTAFSHISLNGALLIYAFSLAGAIIASLFPVSKLFRTSAGDMIKNYL